MTEHKEESLMDKISEKIHGGGDDSSSDTVHYDNTKKSAPDSPSSMKSKIYRLFGREQPVHKVLGGGKRKSRRFPPSVRLLLSLASHCVFGANK